MFNKILNSEDETSSQHRVVPPTIHQNRPYCISEAATLPCPDIACEELCRWGRKEVDGCPSCECNNNPCENVKCPFEERCSPKETCNGDECHWETECESGQFQNKICENGKYCIVKQIPKSEELLAKCVKPEDVKYCEVKKRHNVSRALCPDAGCPEGQLCCSDDYGDTVCTKGCPRPNPEGCVRKGCKYGRKIDENGCPTCQCDEDPFKVIQCRAGYKFGRPPPPPLLLIPTLPPGWTPKGFPEIFEYSGIKGECYRDCPKLDCRNRCQFGKVEIDGCESCTCIDPCTESPCGDKYRCEYFGTNESRRTKYGNYQYYRTKCIRLCPPGPVCDKKCYFGSELKDECPTCDCKDICKIRNIKCPEKFHCEVVRSYCVIGYCHLGTDCAQDVCVAGEPEVDISGYRVRCKGQRKKACSKGFTCVPHSDGNDGSCCPGHHNQL
ncbi:hypothetical protein CAPTEDRAFT_216982 [Capitella teleta]|uniref:Antistasin-like domain-containing protein n=1 Tax=Capitella teleta TaxID=283909 RepID=R7T4Z1_CAPTE|nr:hypothetical protein CAPTEDRAFT_216982 [Capitella teleta]|eukprot:ELT88192.1 hypothetical protein CAPTEDRAFT_216982 [Capitella teleta]